MVDIQEWPIPEEVVPETRVCVSFTIPDNDTYRQILLGWMNQLCYQYNWERDEGHNAVTCSNLFKQSRAEMIASLTEGCMGDDMYFRMRINPDDGCTSEAQYELGGDWIPFMNNCCCDQNQPAEYQINSETGEIEVSTDGGATFDEYAESIYATAITPAPLHGEDGDIKRCEAANNVVENLKDVQAGISEKLALTYTLYDFAIAILVEIVALVLAGITGGGAALLVVPLIPKIIETARAIFGLSQAAYDALFTESVWTAVRCIAYCNVSPNGKFTASAWATVKFELAQQLGSGATQAGANLAAMVDVWALTGLNNAAAIGSGGEGNCDDCVCECFVKFEIVTGSLIETPYYEGYTSYLSAEGIPGTAYAVNIRTPGKDACCQVIDVKYDLVGETGNTFTPFSVLKWDCGQPQDGTNSGGALIGSCINRLQPQGHPTLQAGQQFVMSVLFSDCP